MASVGTGGIASAFAAIFEDYEREVDERLKGDLRYAGELTANVAREQSPSKTGKYGRGWRYEIEEDGLGGASVVIHNVTKPSLTHLLEKGHMDRGGGWVGARVHIGTAFDMGSEALKGRMGL